MKHNVLPILLPVRSIVFLLSFIACATIAGTDVSAIGHWWSMIAVAVNILTILMLIYVAHRNGQTYWQLINYQKGQTRWTAIILLVTLLVLVVGMAGMYLGGIFVVRQHALCSACDDCADCQMDSRHQHRSAACYGWSRIYRPCHCSAGSGDIYGTRFI